MVFFENCYTFYYVYYVTIMINKLFLSRIESVKYNAVLITTGAVRGSSFEKLY